jgi:hypothetical protein
MGWMRPHVDQLNRALGIVPDYSRVARRTKAREFMGYDQAVRLCQAMGADPFECGV